MIIVILIMIALSALFLSGRGSSLIAGYNTAPKEEKEKYDEKALCRFMGRFMLVLAALLILFILSMHLLPKRFELIGVVVFVVVFVAVSFIGIIYANTGGRFLKNNKRG